MLFNALIGRDPVQRGSIRTLAAKPFPHEPLIDQPCLLSLQMHSFRKHVECTVKIDKASKTSSVLSTGSEFGIAAVAMTWDLTRFLTSAVLVEEMFRATC